MRIQFCEFQGTLQVLFYFVYILRFDGMATTCFANACIYTLFPKQPLPSKNFFKNPFFLTVKLSECLNSQWLTILTLDWGGCLAYVSGQMLGSQPATLSASQSNLLPGLPQARGWVSAHPGGHEKLEESGFWTAMVPSPLTPAQPRGLVSHRDHRLPWTSPVCCVRQMSGPGYSSSVSRFLSQFYSTPCLVLISSKFLFSICFGLFLILGYFIKCQVSLFYFWCISFLNFAF